MNVIVVWCNIIYMVFCMIWCSSYIDNLWNELGKNWIITPNQCVAAQFEPLWCLLFAPHWDGLRSVAVAMPRAR